MEMWHLWLFQEGSELLAPRICHRVFGGAEFSLSPTSHINHLFALSISFYYRYFFIDDINFCPSVRREKLLCSVTFFFIVKLKVKFCLCCSNLHIHETQTTQFYRLCPLDKFKVFSKPDAFYFGENICSVWGLKNQSSKQIKAANNINNIPKRKLNWFIHIFSFASGHKTLCNTGP